MLKLKIPPPIYMLSFAALMWLLNQQIPLVEFIMPPWNNLGWLLIAVALLMDAWSLGLFFKSKTTFNPLNPNNTRKLVTDGLYQYTRNPMYLGMAIILTGWGIWLGSLSPFLLIPLFIWVINEQQIKPEELILTEKFGQPYQVYLQKVRRWI